ncbi:hypothetical protein EE612_059377, partial [Oryza sativa]
LHKIFLRLDLDGDGSLTKLELGVLLRSLKLLRLLSLRLAAEDEIHALLAIMELGAWVPSSLIDVLASILTELIVGPCCPIITLDQAEVAEAFRAFDCKGNGFISAIELTRSIADTATPTASSSFYLTVGPITH